MSDYQVSKWLYVNALLTTQELRSLHLVLGEPPLFQNGAPTDGLPYTNFFDDYNRYLEGGSFPALIMTRDDAVISSKEVRPGKFLLKPKYPAIQIREHTYIITSDGRIQSMVFGASSIKWGLQFAYPSLFVDPDSKKVIDVLKEGYPNTLLFKELQSWMRHHTRPAKVVVGDRTINATFRRGLEA